LQLELRVVDPNIATNIHTIKS